jgi:hypothetical protein
VVDLVEEVFDGATRKIDSIVGEFAQDDEIAVPPIHFVEAAAWDNVVMWQIQQSRRCDLLRGKLALMTNHTRQ